VPSLVLALSGQQASPGHDGSTFLIVVAAMLIILSLRAAARSLAPVMEILKSVAAMGIAVFLAFAALAMVILSLFA
jgi:predicted tellurium resistance membrane protein TerC